MLLEAVTVRVVVALVVRVIPVVIVAVVVVAVVPVVLLPSRCVLARLPLHDLCLAAKTRERYLTIQLFILIYIFSWHSFAYIFSK